MTSLDYNYFIVQRDTVCDKCKTELLSGANCFLKDGDLICCDCIEELEKEIRTKGGEQI